MFWVVQGNLYSEQGHEELMGVLRRGGIPHCEVQFVPFTHNLVRADVNLGDYDDASQAPAPDIDESGLVMVCGSTLLARVGAERGWVPGSFLNENFHYERWREHWGEHLLNHVSLVGKLGEVEPQLYPWANRQELFVRPCEDTKAFTGTTMHSSEFDYWRKDLLSQGRDLAWLSKDTPVVVSPYREILAEYRFFVVDGQIVTASMYRLGIRVVYDRHVPPYVSDFAREMVALWQPARAFVIDVAETHDGPKVIELNNINQSGFYSCDMGKIVGAVEAMEF